MTDNDNRRQPAATQNIIGSTIGTNIIRGSWPAISVDDDAPIQTIVDSTVEVNIIEGGR